jgi:hypothetical protein
MNMSTRVILEALCYALQQALFSEIGVTRNTDSEENVKAQLKELVDEINFQIEENYIQPDDLNTLRWYDPSMLVMVLEQDK